MTNTATFRLFVDDVLVDSDQVSSHTVADIHDDYTFEQDVVLGSESTIQVVLKVVNSGAYGGSYVYFGTWPPSGDKPIVASGKLARYGIALVRYSHSGTTLDYDGNEIPFNGSNDEEIIGPGDNEFYDRTFGPTVGRYEYDPYRFDPVEIGEREDVITRSGSTSVVSDSQDWAPGISCSIIPTEDIFPTGCSWDGIIDLYAYRYQRFTFWYGSGYITSHPPWDIRWFKSTEYGSNPLINSGDFRSIGWVLDAPELTNDQLTADPRDIPDSVYANPGTYLGHKIFAQGQTLSAADSAGGVGLFDFWDLRARSTYLPVRSRSNPHDIVRASQAHGNKVIRDER